jgi:hypothetical protein
MKKILVLSVLGLAALGTLSWLANYLSTGTIIVTTNHEDSTIILRGTGQGNSFTKIGLGSLSAAVGHGQYTATAKDGSQVNVQVINFGHGHKTLRYSMLLSGLLQVEPVAYQNTHDVTASNNGLVYLDGNDENLHKIDSQNSLVTIDPALQFQSVKWVNASFGVAQDNNGHLYTINDTSIDPLGVPFSYGGKPVGFDVSQDKQIYVSYGADIYVGDQNGNFKKIYTALSSSPVIAAGTNQVAITDETKGQNAGIFQPLLAIVSNSGRVIKKAGAAGEIRKLVLSPSGQYLVSVNESYASVYDSSLHQIVTVPASSSVDNVEWLDNNKFFYTSRDELWLYDLGSQKAELLATMPFVAGSITSLGVSSDRSYVYLTTGDSSLGNNYAILRVGLKGQSVPGYISKLQGVLPLTLNDCSLSLVNFAQPATILVESFPNSNLSSQAYLQEAQSALAQDGFDLGKLQFKLVPGN